MKELICGSHTLIKVKDDAKCVHCDAVIKNYKNKKIELGVDLYPSLHDITSTFAQMYYETTVEDQRLSALDILVFINNSERYAHLLENV